MMTRWILLLFVLGCGTQKAVSFTCGDGGPTCQTATEYCNIVTKTGSNPSVTASCKPFPSGCSLCDCLIDSGIGGSCIGQTTCTPKDDGTYTVNESCIQ